jgi:hypothetical protein
MWYRRATVNLRDFFRAPALSGTAMTARLIEAPAVARASGAAVKLGAPHPVSGALSYSGQQRRSTGLRTVEGRASIAVALLITGVVAVPAVFSPRDARSAEYTLMPGPQTVHIGHFSAARRGASVFKMRDVSRHKSMDVLQASRNAANKGVVFKGFLAGWGARIRTWEWRNQNPLQPTIRRSEFEASPAFRPRSRIARVAAESDPFGIARLAAAARSLNQDRRRHSRVSIPRQEPEFVTITESVILCSVIDRIR